MPQFFECDRSFLSAGALAQYTRVKFDANMKLEAAGATDHAIGVTSRATTKADEPVSVMPFHKYASIIVVASEAISAGSDLFGAASGQVAGTGTLNLNLKAVTASTAAGQHVEAIPNHPGV